MKKFSNLTDRECDLIATALRRYNDDLIAEDLAFGATPESSQIEWDIQVLIGGMYYEGRMQKQ